MKKLMAVCSLVGGLGLLVSPVMADGNATYEKHCKACHVAGMGGAPKPGDAAAWQPRLAKGVDAMAATVVKGKGAMPPKGTCMSCDDAAIKAAVEVFVGQVQ